MARVKYTLLDREYNSIPENETYASSDVNLIDSYQINKNYNPDLNYIETHFYSLTNEKIFSVYDYNISTDVGTDSEGNITNLNLQPEEISAENGFTGVDHKIVFHFLNDLYSIGSGKQEFFINSISQDRTEVLLYTEDLDANRLINFTEKLKEQFNSSNYFEEFWLNLGDNDLFIVTNIDVYELDDKYTVALKLYEPLPKKFNNKQGAQLVEKVSDSCVVEIQVEVEEDPEVFPTLKGANFNIELDSNGATPTEYFNYDELFSYSTLNSNREIFSYLSEKSVNINIDYSEYTNFINFSSASERLRNFRYKLQLLQSYEGSKLAIDNATDTQALSSRDRYDTLIKGILDNFDHYEKHLYYESGSYTWPKSTTAKPHTNLHTTSSEAINWYNNQLTSASNYDTSNYGVLTNTLPSYISEDTKNNPALLFVSMIGQHFDNLWIYTKAITDKYDADNRLDTGISKDLVRDTLKSFGTKLYNSVEGSNDLFKYLIADTYDSGSSEERINTFLKVPNIPSDSQPISRQDYEGEVYKRIYHNLPFLLKSKGTERGLRALINCFGIPSDFLKIKQYGGDSLESSKFFGFDKPNTSSENKVKYETRASGSVGKVLTKDKSIQKEENEITRDIHRLEVGFSPADSINEYILSQVPSDFSVDDYIGDPRQAYQPAYKDLDKRANTILQGLNRFELNDFVRLLKFYDNVVFKMIKDFVPAKATLDTGIIIKPHLLDRSKAKTPKMSGTRPEFEAEIDTAFITGSAGGAYQTAKPLVKFEKDLEHPWPQSLGGVSDFQFKPDFSNPTAANPGEIVVHGTKFYHPDGTLYTFPDYYRTVYTPYEGNVSTDMDFYIMFTSESVADRFSFNDGQGGSDNLNFAHPHLVPIDYSPHGQNSWVARDNLGSISSSFTPLATDVIIAGFTLSADTDDLSRFTNYTKPLDKIVPGIKSTLYKEDIRTLTGSVVKWVDDDSPKINGELGGSEIEVTDGELNKLNSFKQVNVPALNFDIVPLEESSNVTYTSFQLDPTPNNDATASCATNNSRNTYYHSGTGTYPLTVGDFVFLDISGNTTFNISSADKWFKTDNGYSILLGGTGGSGADIGKVLQVENCSQFDSTPPTGYTATWMTDTINAANKATVPFQIYNGELNSTYEASASLASTPGTIVTATGTITNAATQSATLNTSGLGDGVDVLLDVRLVDPSGNQGAYASAPSHPSAGLTASLKDTTVPSADSVKFYNSANYSIEATTTNTANFYIRVANIPNNEKGTAYLTLSSSGGGTNYTLSTAYNNTVSYSPNIDYIVSSYVHSLPNGTITATVSFQDEAGNSSTSNLTDTIVMNVQVGYIFGASSVSRSSQTKSYTITATPSTLSWNLTENQSWSSVSTTTRTGTGLGSTSVYFSYNSSSSTRYTTLTLRTGTSIGNGTILRQLTVAQSGTTSSGGTGGCVAPDVNIRMGDGTEKKASEIKVGDEVQTRDEKTLEVVNALVKEVKWFLSDRIKVYVGDKEIVVSPKHRFYVDDVNDYVDADELKQGNKLSKLEFKKFEEYEAGEVIQISVEKASTYISNGILSHNAKSRTEITDAFQ
jgi:hypothetical protein